jgi:hypothetical protein
MMTKIEELWIEGLHQVRLRPIESDGFRLLRFDDISRFDIYAGVDSSEFVLLAIGVHSRPSNVDLDSSSLDYFRKQRQDGSWLMVLRLKRAGLSTVFGPLCQDLVDASNKVLNEDALIALFKERLLLWEKLFARTGEGLLKNHEIKGLIGELLFLESLIVQSGRDALESVTGWVGPLSADQDFQFPEVAYEIKAIRPESASVTISSLEQLDCSTPLFLALVSLRLSSPGVPGAIGLNSLTARIEGAIASNPDALSVFKARILEAGYVEHEHYNSVLFIIESMELYRVEDTFPKIVPSMVSKGIENATYEISLDAVKDFIQHSELNHG